MNLSLVSNASDPLLRTVHTAIFQSLWACFADQASVGLLHLRPPTVRLLVRPSLTPTSLVTNVLSSSVPVVFRSGKLANFERGRCSGTASVTGRRIISSVVTVAVPQVAPSRVLHGLRFSWIAATGAAFALS